MDRPPGRGRSLTLASASTRAMTADSSGTKLRGVKACVFDAYGTLFDFAAAARGCRDILGADVDRLTALWRDKQLQYTWLRAVQGRHADFWQVTGDALDFALETLAIDKQGIRERLKDAGIKTAILSNGSPKMLDAVVKSAKL